DGLSAPRLRLAALARRGRGDVRGRPRFRAPRDHVRQRGAALRHPGGRVAFRLQGSWFGIGPGEATTRTCATSRTLPLAEVKTSFSRLLDRMAETVSPPRSRAACARRC